MEDTLRGRHFFRELRRRQGFGLEVDRDSIIILIVLVGSGKTHRFRFFSEITLSVEQGEVNGIAEVVVGATKLENVTGVVGEKSGAVN